MDLNELLYAHQLAVMNASAPHTSLEDRESHLEEASEYADKIRKMPSAPDILAGADPGNVVSQSSNSGETNEGTSSRTSRNLAVLSAWESEGGAIDLSQHSHD